MPSAISVTLSLWDTSTGKPLRRFIVPAGEADNLCLAADGRTLATGGQGAALHLWDSVAGKPVLTWPAHSRRINALSFTPDGRRLVSCDGQTLRLREVSSARHLKELSRERPRYLCNFAITSDGRSVLSGGHTLLRLQELPAGEERQRFLLDEHPEKLPKPVGHLTGHSAEHIGLSTDGRVAACVSAASLVHLLARHGRRARSHDDLLHGQVAEGRCVENRGAEAGAAIAPIGSGAMETVLLMMVCKGVLLLTWTTKVNVAELLAGKESIQAETAPLELPGGGASLLQPGAGRQDGRRLRQSHPTALGPATHPRTLGGNGIGLGMKLSVLRRGGKENVRFALRVGHTSAPFAIPPICSGLYRPHLAVHPRGHLRSGHALQLQHTQLNNVW
ncbi:MAG TPA: hypothetical protein VH575_23955 [Gemmataceae bacterium]